MEVKAELNYLRIAPRKVRLVASVLKGMETKRAEIELKHLPKRSAEPLLKLLKSALANAKHNFQLGEGGFYIKDLRVDPGPVLKRTMPRAFGRAALIRKRMSHVSLVLETKETVAAKPPKASSKEKLIVRDVTLEDVAGEEIRTKESKEPQEKVVQKTKSKGFVRKIFRRKAI